MSFTTASRRVALGATALALTAGGMVATTSSAHAATARDGVCESGEFCLSYNSGFTGSVSDFNTSVDDYGTTQPSCYEFKSAGNGQGVCVKNNAASARNLTGAAVTVYYNSGYAGASQTIPAGATVDLNATLKNQNASHQLGTAPTGGVTPGVIGNDYPYSGATSGVDPWNFYKGQCTSFAAWRVNHKLGLPFSNSYKGQHWGNAINWDNAARAAGIPVSGTPKVGDIAVRNSGSYGHVAYVAAVNSNGTFVIEEYNFATPNHYGTRTASIGTSTNQFDQFIHFKG